MLSHHDADHGLSWRRRGIHDQRFSRPSGVSSQGFNVLHSGHIFCFPRLSHRQMLRCWPSIRAKDQQQQILLLTACDAVAQRRACPFFPASLLQLLLLLCWHQQFLPLRKQVVVLKKTGAKGELKHKSEILKGVWDGKHRQQQAKRKISCLRRGKSDGKEGKVLEPQTLFTHTTQAGRGSRMSSDTDEVSADPSASSSNGATRHTRQ